MNFIVNKSENSGYFVRIDVEGGRSVGRVVVFSNIKDLMHWLGLEIKKLKLHD